MRVLRYLGPVLAAGTAFWLCPFLLAVIIFLTDTKLDNLGRIDNAPYRAALVLLVLTPFSVVMFGLLFLVTSAVLRRLHRYSFHTLVIASVIVAVCIGAYAAAKSLSVFGPTKDAGITFGMFGVSSFICLLLGSIAWWYSSPWNPSNQALKRDVADAAPLS
jgi:hypothetical protein